MSARDRFEVSLPDRLADLASPRQPAYFDNVIDTTARARQRPGWSFAERWFPVSTLTDRMATVPRAPVRTIAIASLVILALAALLVAVVGSRQPRVPPPFGPADNGRIAWVDGTGAILAAAADGTSPVTIVPGPQNDRPLFSPDGTRLLYLHEGPGGTALLVSAADGSNPVTIASDVSTIGAVWAPDSRSVVIAEGGTLARVEAREGAEPVVIARGVDNAFDWNVDPSQLFRPPAGDEIAHFRGVGATTAIVVAGADGSAPREILTPSTAGFPYTGLGALQWSPDGSRLAFVAYLSSDGADAKVFVVDADGGPARRLTHRELEGLIVSEGNPAWSPDGDQIVMQAWHQDGDATDVRPLTVVDVASGEEDEVGEASLNGFISFGWSPDGTSLIAVTDAGSLVVMDAVTGAPALDPWRSTSGATWQRVQP